MTTPINPSKLISELSSTLALPEQTSDKLSFCDSHKLQKLQAWADDLKVTQAVATSVLLYKSLPEISRLKTTYKTRLDMLEAIRSHLKIINKGMAKEYLKKPIILPPEAQKAAIVAQAIQKHLLNGYLISLKDNLLTLNKKSNTNQLNDIACIICRAMHTIQTIFFRSYQLYTRYPKELWKTLHTLYLVGDHFDALNIQVDDDSLNHENSLSAEQVYVRTLLLSASKPNQLSQSDITALYDALEPWCKHAHIHQGTTKNKSNILYIDTLSDNSPFCLGKNQAPQQGWLTINSQNLTDKMDSFNQTARNQKKPYLSQFVIEHTKSAWTQTTERLDQRSPADSQADICIGLYDCHKLLAQGESFENFIDNESGNTSLDQKINTSFTPNSQLESTAGHDLNVAVSSCTIINASQNGFCLLWQGEITPKMQAGEILLIKERDRSKWKLGFVRWIKQLKNASQLGIQIVANDPIPAAIKHISQETDTSYQRALLTQHQDAKTLFCRSRLFSNIKAATVMQNNNSHMIKVGDSIYNTSNITQYTYAEASN